MTRDLKRRLTERPCSNGLETNVFSVYIFQKVHFVFITMGCCLDKLQDIGSIESINIKGKNIGKKE